MELPVTHAAGTADQAVSLLQHLGLRLNAFQEELVQAGIIFLVFLLFALLLRVLFRAALRRITGRAATLTDERLLRALEMPLVVFILATGLLSALATLDQLTALVGGMARIYGALVVLLGTIVTLRLLSVALDSYSARFAEHGGAHAGHYAGLLQKIFSVIIWGIGFIIILGQLGIEITPLVTTLGLGSLAIALALQDTLANFFAGIYLMLDRPIKVGDYVRLETGDEGFVHAIGWRSTKIRLWSNYIVVLPNSRLTSSVITNMVLSQSETTVTIPGGVSYLSDLDHVERVLIAVAREVQHQVDGAVPDAEPLVRFQTFGDSNITFNVILRVRDFSYQYVLKHEFIKALFRRFKQEGIEISWPVRQLVAAHPIPVTLAGQREGADVH